MTLIRSILVGLAMLALSVPAIAATWSTTLIIDPAILRHGWISTRNLDLTWTAPAEPVQGYSVYLSDSAFIDADFDSDTTATHWPLTDIADGTYYFSVHYQDLSGHWTRGSNQRIKVDCTPPAPPASIQLFESLMGRHAIAPGSSIRTGTRPWFNFIAAPSDHGSRIQGYRYQLLRNDQIVEDGQSNQASLFPKSSFDGAGRYQLRVWSQDEAGWENPQPTQITWLVTAS